MEVSQGFVTTVSAPADGAEASSSGYAAGESSDCEVDDYGNVSLASNENSGSDTGPPSSKRPKLAATSGRRNYKPTGKFITSWKLPEHITESKRGNT